MAALEVEVLQRGDGGAVLRGRRADGTTTWQRHEGAQAGFFPLHDLTHYALEQVLGARRGFFGLVAAGWDIADTSGKGARGPLPPEALGVERIVGLLDTERASGATWSAAEFGAYAPGDELGAVPLDDAALGRIRALRDELFGRWRAVPPEGALTLRFEFEGGRG